MLGSIACIVRSRNDWAKLMLLLERRQVEANSLGQASRLARLQGKLLHLQTLRLFVEQENIPMRATGRRRGGSNIVSDRARAARDERGTALAGLQVRLHPVEDWTEEVEGLEGRIQVEFYQEEGPRRSEGPGQGELGLTLRI